MKTWAFLRHFWGAKTRYGVHSPFVYEFVTRVLPHRNTPRGAEIEQMRRQFLGNNTVIEIEDLGAGYGGNHHRVIRKKLKEVARGSARRRRPGELLMRIAAWHKPEVCLEFGTNLGFSALYLLAGLPDGSRFVTVEGSGALCQIASANLKTAGRQFELLNSPFAQALEQEPLKSLKPGLIFLDGHHQEKPTLEYFHTLLPHIPDGGLVVLDDIHWSAGMERAWKEIGNHPEVTVTLDLYSLGLAFVRRNQAKEHFDLRFLG